MAFPGLADRVADVQARIRAAVARGGHRQPVTIVAVTKTHGPEAARAAYEAGLHDVGENKVQEALGKMKSVDVPVRWHLIGHLQRNKVKALEHFAMLHAMDSSRLADAVCKFGIDSGRAIDALVEMTLSGEESKGGCKEMERLTRINQDLDAKARSFHEQLRHFREKDKAMNDALVSAQQLSVELKEQAEKEAQLIVRGAEQDAEKLREQARAEIRRMEEE